MKLKNVYLILAVVAFVAATALLLAGGHSHEAVASDQTAATPALELTTLEGQEWSLAGHEGKVVLVNFWATWCPPCRAEIPHFNEIYAEHKEDGLEIFGVSLDRGGESVVREWMQSNEVAYPVAMGDQATAMGFMNLLPADQRGGIPFSFIIDREGNIAHQLVGYREKDVWLGMIAPLLETAPE